MADLKQYTGEILSLFDSGTTVVDLAKRYDSAYSSIRDLLKRNGKEISRKTTIGCCNLCDVDAAYIAGLVDGEGCFYAKSVLTRQTTTIQVGLAVANTDKAILDWLVKTTELGSVSQQKRNNKSNWKPLWRWSLSTQSAASLARQILPYLKIKKLQAELVVELADIRIKSKRLSKNCPERQIEIVKMLSQLNQRGAS